jgi:hypothetical protein
MGFKKGDKTNLRHGHWINNKASPTYSSWRSMHSRCYNKGMHCYDQYGGAGIVVCRRWHKFDNFLADMGERPEGHTLDRHPSSSKIYSPETCRWATRKQQCRNQLPERFRGRTSKYKGVCFRKKKGGGKQWRASIYLGKRQLEIGTYATEEGAARAYDKKAKELWGDDAYLNFST